MTDIQTARITVSPDEPLTLGVIQLVTGTTDQLEAIMTALPKLVRVVAHAQTVESDHALAELRGYMIVGGSDFGRTLLVDEFIAIMRLPELTQEDDSLITRVTSLSWTAANQQCLIHLADALCRAMRS